MAGAPSPPRSAPIAAGLIVAAGAGLRAGQPVPKQFAVWRAGLQYSAGMSARADSAIHIAPRPMRTHRVYNLLVKYG